MRQQRIGVVLVIVARGERRTGSRPQRQDRIAVLLQIVNAVLEARRADVKDERLAGGGVKAVEIDVLVLLDRSAQRGRQRYLLGLLWRIVVAVLLDHRIAHDDELPDRAHTLGRRNPHVAHARLGVGREP